MLLRRVATVVLGLAAFAPVAAPAETWQWHHLWHVVTGSTVDSQLAVTVAGGQASWSYVAMLQKRRTVIFSCHAPAADVDGASPFRDGDQISLVIVVRNGRSANCGATQQRVSAIPGDSYPQMQQIAAGINRVLAANRPAQKPQAAATPSPRPTPLPRPTPASPPNGMRASTLPSTFSSPLPPQRGNRGKAPVLAEPAEVIPDIRPRLLTRGTSLLGIGHRGVARVRVLIGADGAPQEATVLSLTDRALAPAAIETAVSSTYAPATKNGAPIAATYVATFSFNGEDPTQQSIPVWRRAPLATPTPTEEPTPAPTPTFTPTPTPTPPPTPRATPTPTPSPTPTPKRRGAPVLRGVYRAPKPTPTPSPSPR